MQVPTRPAQTAIGIRNARLRTVSVAFYRTGFDFTTATYEAACPRCLDGVLKASIRLAGDGSFLEPPACPSLCERCEERLDAILDGADKARSYESTHRITLDRRLPMIKRT